MGSSRLLLVALTFTVPAWLQGGVGTPGKNFKAKV